MDKFVSDKLTAWGLSKFIKRFKDEGVSEESFYCLRDQHIDKLIEKAGPNAIFKHNYELFKAGPSTSDTTDKGKRKLDFQGESRRSQSQTSKRPRHTAPGSNSDETILSDVKNIMKNVQEKIPNQDNNLNDFLKTKIDDLDTDKREQVGVFGKTGAGKSSLINAVIGEKNLLPTGSVSACTSVMIKVEANMLTSKYEAHIEFITEEEWKEELSLYQFLRDEITSEKKDGDIYRETVNKLSALYGEEYKKKSQENLMDKKYFKEIKEFLESKPKILKSNTAEDLSAEMAKYTRNDSKDRQVKGVKRWYWPLVKCVTVKVPNNDLLKHVTLVDLPGNGDRNKSRDEMWKGVVGNCSTVWIVTEINRAAAEIEAWEILERACQLIGNGGECQHIHFICTKSDHIEKSKNRSPADVRALIFQQNACAKKEVTEEFRQNNQITKHFSGQSMEVFTVSSQEFLEGEHLKPDETEIPKLQKFLHNLNDGHSETLNYVSGAYGILSLIEGASRRDLAGKKENVCTNLKEKMRDQLDNIRRPIEKAYEVFEECLSKGVEKSVSSCEDDLQSILFPDIPDGRGFHKILRCVVVNNGFYISKKGAQINLNVTLASHLTNSIDEEFKKTFPNDRRCEPFKGIISKFSLEPEKLIQDYKDVELQLIFLKTEEEKIKTKLNKIIRDEKKTIYRNLVKTIEETMQDCYTKAARLSGKNMLIRMREAIKKQVQDSKDTMFEKAKGDMLTQLQCLKVKILETLETTMQESIELSLKADGDSIPGFPDEFKMVRNYYIELNINRDEETAIWLVK